MNDKIRMLEAKRARLIEDLAQVDLALHRAKTGYIGFCTKLDGGASATQGACLLKPDHEGACVTSKEKP